MRLCAVCKKDYVCGPDCSNGASCACPMKGRPPICKTCEGAQFALGQHHVGRNEKEMHPARVGDEVEIWDDEHFGLPATIHAFQQRHGRYQVQVSADGAVLPQLKELNQLVN